MDKKEWRDRCINKGVENTFLKKQLDIAVEFMKFVERYNCNVVTPKDFSKYEGAWFLIRIEAIEKLKQINLLEEQKQKELVDDTRYMYRDKFIDKFTYLCNQKLPEE